ncbi:MAG: hypothetical protein PHD76_14325 [Methylacidiphilales bacterium]|nr:hypothetical protein [Candidatus Methylacidiphilales bacterium]
MSWKQAQEEARKWLANVKLPPLKRGDVARLHEHIASLQFEGHFRRMVLRAVERDLKKKGLDWDITEYD